MDKLKKNALRPESDTKVVNMRVKYLRPHYQNQIEWSKNPNHVNIGRGNVLRVKTDQGYITFPNTASPFANPFTLKNFSREKSIEMYESYIRQQLENKPNLKEELLGLKGKTLGCWCKPEPCHGDVLVKLIKEFQ